MSILNKLQIEEVELLSLQFKKEHPYLRYGQSFFILLEKIHPKIANNIRGSKYDPFHFESIDICTEYLLSDIVYEEPIDIQLCNNIIDVSYKSFINTIDNAIDNYTDDINYRKRMKEHIHKLTIKEPLIYK